MRFQAGRLARKYGSPLVTVLVAALALLLLQPSGAVAGTIFIDDRTETPTVTISGDAIGRASASCNAAEGCSITVNAPAGFAGAPTGASDVNILDPVGPLTPTSVSAIGVSDIIKFVVFGVPVPGLPGVAHFNFISDAEILLPATGAPIAGVGGPITLTETGGVQTATTITWGTVTTDTITFASDVETVPEPGTLLLLGTGLIGVAVWGQGRLRRRVNS